jgi:4-hydroxybenzoate polyprenyltransferase
MSAAVRVVHPAPAAAVTGLAAALAAIIGVEGDRLDWTRLALVVLSVAGSQIFTGATNDWADRHRDAAARPEKPIPAGDLSPAGALLVALVGVLLQVATSLPLGMAALGLGLAASASALAYNLVLSRTPASVVPYLVSFGLLPLWIAAGMEVDPRRVVAASLLVAPFAAAAHLANTLRDWKADAAGGSRSLAQLLGQRTSRWLALGMALAVGLGVGAALAIAGRLAPLSAALGAVGLVAVTQGAFEARRLWYGMLVAALCWTVAWALATA